MKKLLLSAALTLAALLTCVQSWAQVPTDGYNVIVQRTTIRTNACLAQSATNVAAIIDVGHQAGVGVQIHQANDATGTADIGYFFQRSCDGITFDTLGQLVSVAANGATAVDVVTNLPSYGARYIRLTYITNAAATANCTNLVVGYAVKMSAP